VGETVSCQCNRDRARLIEASGESDSPMCKHENALKKMECDSPLTYHGVISICFSIFDISKFFFFFFFAKLLKDVPNRDLVLLNRFPFALAIQGTNDWHVVTQGSDLRMKCYCTGRLCFKCDHIDSAQEWAKMTGKNFMEVKEPVSLQDIKVVSFANGAIDVDLKELIPILKARSLGKVNLEANLESLCTICQNCATTLVPSLAGKNVTILYESASVNVKGFLFFFFSSFPSIPHFSFHLLTFSFHFISFPFLSVFDKICPQCNFKVAFNARDHGLFQHSGVCLIDFSLLRNYLYAFCQGIFFPSFFPFFLFPLSPTNFNQ